MGKYRLPLTKAQRKFLVSFLRRHVESVQRCRADAGIEIVCSKTKKINEIIRRLEPTR